MIQTLSVRFIILTSGQRFFVHVRYRKTRNSVVYCVTVQHGRLCFRDFRMQDADFKEIGK